MARRERPVGSNLELLELVALLELHMELPKLEVVLLKLVLDLCLKSLAAARTRLRVVRSRVAGLELVVVDLDLGCLDSGSGSTRLDLDLAGMFGLKHRRGLDLDLGGMTDLKHGFDLAADVKRRADICLAGA